MGPQHWWNRALDDGNQQIVLLSREVDPPAVLFLQPPDALCHVAARQLVIRDDHDLANLIRVVEERVPGRDA